MRDRYPLGGLVVPGVEGDERTGYGVTVRLANNSPPGYSGSRAHQNEGEGTLSLRELRDLIEGGEDDQSKPESSRAAQGTHP